MVREHYRKYGEIRLVELLYDDLRTWNDWVFTKRTLAPGGLVSVGSDPANTAPHDGHTKQAAIWETGMDNSPMYDEVTWNSSLNKMLIYDVGMTSQYLGEIEALTELAAALNKTDDIAMLKERQADMASTLQATLWSKTRQIYLNYQVDTATFNTHTSPTSFYPMLSGTASPEQVRAMYNRWLTNHSGYCLGNSSMVTPTEPVTPPSFSLYWSSAHQDNAVCLTGSPGCITNRTDFGTINTTGVDAKHRSATVAVQGRLQGCCPKPMWSDQGGHLDDTYEWVRFEGMQLPTAAELASVRNGTVHRPGTVMLKMFYSDTNRDNFVGTNATLIKGYREVTMLTANSAHPPRAAAATLVAFAAQPNASYVPLDLFWSKTRKDFQNVVSPRTRKLLHEGNYVFVQRLGWVLPASGGGRGKGAPFGPCRFALPSTPNDDPAYLDNSYWRGRVWGPLNLLVYVPKCGIGTT